MPKVSIERLREIEWAGAKKIWGHGAMLQCCPICNELRGSGHQEGCWLGGLLKEENTPNDTATLNYGGGDVKS